MGLRFRKSISVAKGVKVNINKKSASVTVGKRGAHYTINTTGKQTASVGLPGTGLSYSKSFGGKKKSSKKTSSKKGNAASGNSSVGENIENAAQSAANNSGCIILAIAAVAILALIVLGIWGLVKLVSNHSKKADTSKGDTAITQTVNADDSQNTDSGSSSASTDKSEKVWVTASGSKYHSKSDCGGISNAYQITLSEAEQRGLTPCKKCH